MANMMKALKAEIARGARKEVRLELGAIKRIQATHRTWIADLRRQIATLQKQIAALGKATPAQKLAVAAAAGAPAEAGRRFWITGKGVLNLRKRLGLTQAQLGKLAGVSGQTVVLWEATKGKISLRRKETPVRLQEIRGMTKRSLKKLMPELFPAKKKTPVKAARKAPAKKKAAAGKKAPKKAAPEVVIVQEAPAASAPAEA